MFAQDLESYSAHTKKNLRILASGARVAKNQKRIFAMDDGRIRAHPGILLRYVGRFLEKPLRGNYILGGNFEELRL